MDPRNCYLGRFKSYEFLKFKDFLIMEIVETCDVSAESSPLVLYTAFPICAAVFMKSENSSDSLSQHVIAT